MDGIDYNCTCLQDGKIEVYRFGVIAENINPHQLEKLGADGFSLTHSWALDEGDYGPNQRYFIFEKVEV